MALTEEHQAQIDMQSAIEQNRITLQAVETARSRKMDVLRMAKDILVDNRRTQAAADAADITSSAITALATELNTYINS